MTIVGNRLKLLEIAGNHWKSIEIVVNTQSFQERNH